MTDNLPATTDDKPVIGTPFKKGVSGNPSGRPKGIIAKMKEMVSDDALIGEALAMLGLHKDKRKNKKKPVSNREKTELLKLLMAYRFGRPSQHIELDATLSTLADRLNYMRKNTEE